MYKNRFEAGKILAQKIKKEIVNLKNTVIIALPRGGVPVAFEIAKELNLPLDIFSIKKIGAPSDPELALGAVSEEGVVYLNNDILSHYNFSNSEIRKFIEDAKQRALDLGRELRGKDIPLDLKNKNILLVDDGIATGATIKAAIELLRQYKVRKVAVIAPVCAKETFEELKKLSDEIYVPYIPVYFGSVGRHYEYFPQVSSSEVVSLLLKSQFSQIDYRDRMSY